MLLLKNMFEECNQGKAAENREALLGLLGELCEAQHYDKYSKR